MPKVGKYPTFRAADDQTVNIVQRETRSAVKDLATNPLVSGLLVSVKLTTGTTLVSHQLGRRWLGWILVDTDTAVTVHRDGSSQADRSLYIPLVSSAAATVTLWVF